MADTSAANCRTELLQRKSATCLPAGKAQEKIHSSNAVRLIKNKSENKFLIITL